MSLAPVHHGRNQISVERKAAATVGAGRRKRYQLFAIIFISKGTTQVRLGGLCRKAGGLELREKYQFQESVSTMI